MASIAFNVAKGRAVEFAVRVKNNDPANSAIIVVPVDVGATSDATIRDMDTLAAILAGGVTERTTGGWSRKTLTDADLGSIAPNDGADTYPFDLPDVSWSTVTAGAVTDLIVCYDSDTTGGTDSAVVPIGMVDFTVTPDGSTVVAKFSDIDFFTAS